ncbi:ferredoxin family protein, putative [Ammonifex degensii KC4]|uniref:Ferredoxin n=1 Tax=Ammonifex degensii (strain DSM 10501 / KC4) TaxID=429009 RepID=C9R8U0_AMMDK|nr:ferredoxin [Ammonifex degensii]ACX52719.1 ferredoxin family protein, putative [Ammonifex degensii KC4]
MPRIPYIETSECMACGTCEVLVPEVFRLDPDKGYAEVINPHGAPEDKIQEAIDSCPAECIHWVEE